MQKKKDNHEAAAHRSTVTQDVGARCIFTRDREIERERKKKIKRERKRAKQSFFFRTRAFAAPLM